MMNAKQGSKGNVSISLKERAAKNSKKENSSIPNPVMKVLKSVKDPHTGECLYGAGMLTGIKISGKKIRMKLVAPGFGCECCGMIGAMTNELSEGLKKIGYKAEIEVGF